MTETCQVTLSEFLLDQIADDEAAARRDFGDDETPGSWTRWVIDECAMKRRIVEFLDARDGDEPLLLRLLALSYTYETDFRPEWRI